MHTLAGVPFASVIAAPFGWASTSCDRLGGLGADGFRRFYHQPGIFGLPSSWGLSGRKEASVRPMAAGADHLTWHTTMVQGRRANYGMAGAGMPVLFLHGFGLGHHSYKRALKRLVRLGCRVYAPALPGFGGTSDLPAEALDLAGYAAWVRAFLDAVGVEESVFVIGHSFGGAVSVQLAHDHGDRVSYLVLINAVGGGTWLEGGSRVRSMAERPLWDWMLSFPADVLPVRSLGQLSRSTLEDAVANVAHNPVGMWRVLQMLRRVDLTPELRDLKATGIPLVALRGDQDNIIPKASFDALCAALGSPGEVVHGRHSWLLTDPDAFGEVLSNSVAVARAARELDVGLQSLS